MSKPPKKIYLSIEDGHVGKLTKIAGLDYATGMPAVLCPNCGQVKLKFYNEHEFECPNCKEKYRLFLQKTANTYSEQPTPLLPYIAAVFALAICVLRPKSQWNNVTGKPLAEILPALKDELDVWYAVIPAHFVTDTLRGKNYTAADSIVLVIDGIAASEQDVFTGKALSRLAVMRVLDQSAKKGTKITLCQNVEYNFISTVPGLEFKKP